jgi:hypothetical protein
MKGGHIRPPSSKPWLGRSKPAADAKGRLTCLHVTAGWEESLTTLTRFGALLLIANKETWHDHDI